MPLQQSSITRGPLVVKGRVTFNNVSKNFAGTSSVPLSDAHILNGCTASTTHTPCQNNGVDNVYATVLDGSLPAGLTPPVPTGTTGI